MEVEQTRELFAPLIKHPEMKDTLLERPPFKFIHDIVKEVVKATGYLINTFNADELDYKKVSASKVTKADFLKKLKSNVNNDGSLDSVNVSKIIAGKEPELTNLLLQKLAINAAESNVAPATKVTKTKSKSSDRDKSKERKKKTEEEDKKKSKKDRDREVEREKRRLSKASIILSEAGAKEAKPKSRSKSKDRKSKDIKTKKSDRKEETKIDSPIIRDDSSPRRESSGGTSKGEDSGIAEESELHDTARQSRRVSASSNRDLSNADPVTINEVPADPVQIPEPLEVPPSEFKRPTTASGRPATSMGRPGTAAARPAPPKVKKTKVADIDPVSVSQQPIAFEKSAVISEEPAQKEEDDGFLIDEDESRDLGATVDGTNISDLKADSQDHGALINRIIENTKELEKDGMAVEDMEFDLHEHKKMRLEVEGVQRSLQSSAQSVQPLTRTLEFISEDLSFLLREVETNRQTATEVKRNVVELRSQKVDGIGSGYAQLRNLDDELKDVRSQITKVMAQILENEKQINELMMNN
ncbi:unnamed protein product [Bursaphelenchus okinawaensis]|uniref:TRAF3-interacting protein 1 n=1 Tax=Bursaphelenchus okinawaensis TaxID=465554 RepID=A0A811KQL4_9BILA|nr:unnamed protein product [Bursaphelenchus okinawaensis]CAG9111702.1 unnamed protein product [Bursaphelenchus okinawaensis]